MKSALATLCMALVIGGGIAAQSRPFQQPVETLVGPPPPVESLAELFALSPVVVVAAVEATGSPSLTPQTSPAVWRIQILRVIHVLKDPENMLNHAPTLRLRLIGGTVFDATSGKEYRTNFDLNPLLPGEEAVYFLRPRTGALEARAAASAPRGNQPERIFGLSAGYYSVFPRVSGSDTYQVPALGVKWPELNGKKAQRLQDLQALLPSVTR